MKKSPLRSLLTDAILIAVAPVLAYVFAYSYERGFAIYLKYPEEVIALSLGNVPQFSAVVIGFLFLTALILNTFSSLFLKHAIPYFSYYVPRFALFVHLALVVPALMFGFQDITFFLLPLTFLVFGAVILFVLPILENKGIPKWSDRFDAHWKSFQNRPNTMFSLLNEKFGKHTCLALAVAFCLFVLAFLGGVAGARNKKEFLILKGESECVVLRTFGDTAICARFNRDEKILTREYRFIKIGEASERSFVVEEVGPLHPPR